MIVDIVCVVMVFGLPLFHFVRFSHRFIGVCLSHVPSCG